MLKRALIDAGIRHRAGSKKLPGRPDFVFSGRRLVVFVDGDFWHGRNWRERKRRLASGSNARYWLDKIAGNIRRDKNVSQILRAEGWKVVRVWESEVRANPERVASHLATLLKLTE